jgi:hypothetical protein
LLHLRRPHTTWRRSPTPRWGRASHAHRWMKSLWRRWGHIWRARAWRTLLELPRWRPWWRWHALLHHRRGLICPWWRGTLTRLHRGWRPPVLLHRRTPIPLRWGRLILHHLALLRRGWGHWVHTIVERGWMMHRTICRWRWHAHVAHALWRRWWKSSTKGWRSNQWWRSTCKKCMRPILLHIRIAGCQHALCIPPSTHMECLQWVDWTTRLSEANLYHASRDWHVYTECSTSHSRKLAAANVTEKISCFQITKLHPNRGGQGVVPAGVPWRSPLVSFL